MEAIIERSALMWRKLVLRSMSPSLSILRVRLVTSAYPTRAGQERRSERSVRRVPATARSDDATWPEDLPRPRGFCRVRTGARRAFEFLRSSKNIDLSLATILSEHAATYERIRKGDTVGAFQIEAARRCRCCRAWRRSVLCYRGC